jgi:serine/threonine protein kinase
MDYLHSQDIMHGDLKAVRDASEFVHSRLALTPWQSNVLIDDEDRAHVADYGLLGLLSGVRHTSTLGEMGSTRWQAPESVIIPAGDVFSFAMVCVAVNSAHTSTQ